MVLQHRLKTGPKINFSKIFLIKQRFVSSVSSCEHDLAFKIELSIADNSSQLIQGHNLRFGSAVCKKIYGIPGDGGISN